MLRFRWAYCQLQELKKLKAIKPKYVKKLLNNLPATLDATYERMLSGIEDMFCKEALTLLQWLAYAQSPPTLGELAEATIIDLAAEESVDVDERGKIEGTLQILAGLVLLQDPFGADGGDDALAEVDYVSDNIQDEDLDRGRKGFDTSSIAARARHLINKNMKPKRREVLYGPRPGGIPIAALRSALMGLPFNPAAGPRRYSRNVSPYMP
ncbi:hypothetical protein CBER1_11924 [Cercospora berteroae]|uniref:Uncharacterized protein n=1 Tax=Cercospora berteroae TaxID=357750 RepID=A0A2S6C0K3_9PEZI|nr:hypothetical protein CBER1_11924 [Cercospora berteroae]